MIGFDHGSGARAANTTAAESAIIGRDGGRERAAASVSVASQRGRPFTAFITMAAV